MQEVIDIIEKSAHELRAMRILCEGRDEVIARAFEPALDKIALELTDCWLKLRSLQV